MKIDFHNHYYPPEYLDALAPSGSTLRITHDDDGNPVVHYPGDYNVMVRGHRDIAYRENRRDGRAHFDDEHHRVLHHRARIQLGKGIADGTLHNRRIE